MLPAQARLRSSKEFTSTVRRGVRVGRPTLVMHVKLKSHPPTRVGFVVSKAVGNAVVRNRVKRRLRHLAADQLSTQSPVALDVVVRALPAAATEPGRLAGDLASAWNSATARVTDGGQR